MKLDIKLKLAILFFVFFGIVYLMATKSPKLGLDIQGGMSITLKVDIDKVVNDQYMNLAKDIEKKLQPQIEVLSIKQHDDGLVVSL